MKFRHDLVYRIQWNLCVQLEQTDCDEKGLFMQVKSTDILAAMHLYEALDYYLNE